MCVGTGVTLPAEGHEVSVGGSVGDYWCQIQLSNITEIVDLAPTLPIELVLKFAVVRQNWRRRCGWA